MRIVNKANTKIDINTLISKADQYLKCKEMQRGGDGY